MNSCLYTGTLRHRRSRPVVHDFRYRVFHFYLDLDELDDVQRRVGLFSVNAHNIVTFHDTDHVDCRPGPTKDKVHRFAMEQGDLDLRGGKVFVLTSCRIFGYVFNPISLYYCHGRGGGLKAIIAEVSNTFGERYLYLLCDRHRPSRERGCYRVRKAMHVSPFVSMDAVYEFHLPEVGDKLGVSIVEYESERHVLDAQLWGTRVPLTSATLRRLLVTYPFMTLRTIAGIHSQALRLFLKRVPIHHQPSPTAKQRAQREVLEGLRRS
jgi:DUF1365 family protein